MAIGRETVQAYSELLARAFNGAIVVNGQRIVGHPSGTLIARTPNGGPAERRVPLAGALDRENDWSDV